MCDISSLSSSPAANKRCNMDARGRLLRRCIALYLCHGQYWDHHDGLSSWGTYFAAGQNRRRRRYRRLHEDVWLLPSRDDPEYSDTASVSLSFLGATTWHISSSLLSLRLLSVLKPLVVSPSWPLPKATAADASGSDKNMSSCSMGRVSIALRLSIDRERKSNLSLSSAPLCRIAARKKSINRHKITGTAFEIILHVIGTLFFPVRTSSEPLCQLIP